MDRPHVIALVGPTASGKTGAGLLLAEQTPCEIISMDSALVYREMDVGTAKPTREERARVPHHLIDIIDPTDAYSVARFRDDCLRLIDEITARGKLPLLVGGTMLYLKGLTDGLDDLPATPAALRETMEAELAAVGLPALYARLQRLDPTTAARLQAADAQRITRALEVIELTGKPFSTLLAQREKTPLPFALDVISLEPSDRAGLHARIAQRFDHMLQDDALLIEVEHLRKRGDLHPGLPSMRCVGYRQAWEYLDGTIDRHTLRETGIAATRQLCKRQLTWLRAMPERIVIDCLADDAAQRCAATALGLIDAARHTPLTLA